ncbi:hypothetical protein BDR22DRAFT_654105 [Usnea florida]
MPMPQSSSIPPPNQPALSPPPGVPAEFYSPFTLRPYETLTIVGSVITTTVMVAARLYTKKFIIKALKWEDYTCVVGWAFFMVFVAIDWCIANHGGGTHMWNINQGQIQYQKRYGNYSDIVYSISIFHTKCSILLLILRVFCSVKRNIGYWLTQSLIVVNAIFYLAYFFVPIFQCSPRTKIWTPEEPGSCMDVEALYIASATFNVASDIAMLSVPIYLIWNLQMSRQRKVGISAIFAAGGLACIASILRMVYLVKLTKTQDYSYVKLQTVAWGIAEVAFGLLCSCLVVLPRLYQHLASITPHNSDNSTLARAMADQNIPAPHDKTEWIKLQDRTNGKLSSPPSETFKEEQWKRGGRDA